MHRKHLVPVSAAAIAGALALCGCASAATKTPTPRSPVATSTSGRPAGPQASTPRGPVQITGYSDIDGPKSTVVLTGTIGDVGEAVRTYANGRIEHEYNQLDVVITRGSFELGIAGIESDLISAFDHFVLGHRDRTRADTDRGGLWHRRLQGD